MCTGLHIPIYGYSLLKGDFTIISSRSSEINVESSASLFGVYIFIVLLIPLILITTEMTVYFFVLYRFYLYELKV